MIEFSWIGAFFRAKTLRVLFGPEARASFPRKMSIYRENEEIMCRAGSAGQVKAKGVGEVDNQWLIIEYVISIC